MAALVLGLPLLFSRRWPTLTRWYAFYAVGFVALNQLSELLIDECFITTISRTLWQSAKPDSSSNEWFTVRLAEAIFHMTPSHEGIKLASKLLLLTIAAGILYQSLRARQHRQRHAAMARSSNKNTASPMRSTDA